MTGSSLKDYVFKLYVSGDNPRSNAAVINIREICEENLEGIYSLEIIDVQEKPKAAAKDKILATPTIIRLLPSPIIRLIGDLSDKNRVLSELALLPSKDEI